MKLPVLRMAIFALASVACLMAAGPITFLLFGASGSTPVSFSFVISLLLILTTVALLRMEGMSFKAMQTFVPRNGFQQLLGGFVVAALVTGAAVFLRAALVDVHIEIAPLTAWSLVSGLPAMLALMLPEELFFRGYLLRSCKSSIGVTAAIGVSAVLFGLYHVVGKGFWGVGAFFLFLTPAVMGAVLAWAAFRTRSLCLPVGLHLGGNWALNILLPLHGANQNDAFARVFSPDLQIQGPILLAVLLLGVYVAFSTRKRLDKSFESA